MPLPRLSDATLDRLAPELLPKYERRDLAVGIVHLGLGAFHRAHMAAYTDAIIASGDRRWGILGASLRSPETRDALEPQDGLYTLVVAGSDQERLSIIGSITKMLVAPENPAALIDAMSHPDVAIVSLTVTEKGYCHDPATGNLDLAHRDIVHDLAHPEAPRSAPGFLCAAIARRRAAGLPPFTVLCCDNLPANGQTVHKIITQFAAQSSADLAAYIDEKIFCPDTMVDRIVPATTDADKARVANALGLRDEWPVMTEPFTQWVIEDRFSMGRPDWDKVGALFVSDVAPFELMKLRLLNGSHSSLAYLGYLIGYETVAEAIADPDIARFVTRLMADTTTTLKLPAGIDVGAYRQQLIERFSNRALKHRTWQIAMDGSQKLPQRLLGTIRDLIAANRAYDAHALGVAAWMRYVSGIDEKGQKIDVRDPLTANFAEIYAKTGPDAQSFAAGLLDLKVVFGDLAANDAFRAKVTAALQSLFSHGAKATLAQFGG